MSRRASLERDLLIVVCAVSAGIHAALVPEHLEEGTAAGLGFAISAAALAVLAVALTRKPKPSTAALAATAVTLAGLLAAYALAITTGVPVLHPEPEAVDGLALFTKAVEAAGLVAALDLLGASGAAFRLTHQRTQGDPA